MSNVSQSYSYVVITKVGTVPEQDARICFWNNVGVRFDTEITDAQGETTVVTILGRNLQVDPTPPPVISNLQPTRIKCIRWGYNVAGQDLEITAAGETTFFFETSSGQTETNQVTVDAYTGVSFLSTLFLDLDGTGISPIDTVDKAYDYLFSYLTKLTNQIYGADAYLDTRDKQNYTYDISLLVLGVTSWDFDLQGRSLVAGATAPLVPEAQGAARFINGTLDNLNLDYVSPVNQSGLTITGTLTFQQAGTFTFTNCTINEVVNTSGQAVTINIVNSTITTNTGPNITINNNVNIALTILDETDNTPLTQARGYLEATAGGGLPVGTVILPATDADGSGIISGISNIGTDQPFKGLIAEHGSPGLYVAKPITGTISATTGLTQTISLVRDE